LANARNFNQLITPASSCLAPAKVIRLHPWRDQDVCNPSKSRSWSEDQSRRKDQHRIPDQPSIGRCLCQARQSAGSFASSRAVEDGGLRSSGRASQRPMGSKRLRSCFAACARANRCERLRQNNPTGKSAKTCPPLAQKIFRLTRRANQRYQLARLTRYEGRCARHERAVGCGGRDGALDETHVSRTAKSCGPGAPVLALSFVGQVLTK
jgi:hypothetical protein